MSATILAGGTPSVTGGTSQTFTLDSTKVNNGVHMQDATVADYRVRPALTAVAKLPTLQSDGSYTKQKCSAVLIRPKILASGKTVFNLVRIEVEVHPELSAADHLALRNDAAQLLFDSDFSNFWNVGSLSF